MSKSLLANEASPYFSRELSWLSFNDRVLEEAADPGNPPLERLKFLSIVSSNLEEFFMVRIARLNRQAQSSSKATPYYRDAFEVGKLLDRIRQWVEDQKTRQTKVYWEVKKALAEGGLIIEEGPSARAKEILEKRVLPYIMLQTISPSEKLPHIAGSKLHLLAKHGITYSLVKIPPTVPRIIIVKSKYIFLVDRLVFSYPELVFPGKEVDEIFSFKISRDAAIELDDDLDDPALGVEEALKDRDSGDIVRVEFDSPDTSAGVQWLKSQLIQGDARKFYPFNLPLDLKSFIQIYNIKKYKKLKSAFADPVRPKNLPAGLSVSKFFSVLDKKDILLHHPYSSFDPVVELVRNAAHDPKVTRICQTLYRTSGNSPVIEALILAAKAGKKVTVLVEIKARFDEANNVRMARALEKSGARVVYGTTQYKVHAKITYIEKKLAAKTKRYAHVSTGNYHPKTAKIYTDIGLITTDAEMCGDAKTLFDLMEQMDTSGDYSLLETPDKFASHFACFVVAPEHLFEQVLVWIEREISFAKAGKRARIRVKMNGLVEHRVIDALYRASQAGVQIDLFIRGVCCLRPGVKGLSENIRVRSIVDKYLEHSRLFIFENGGDEKVYLSSADWMPRNFFKRVEVAIPIKNPEIKKFLMASVWEVYEQDNIKAKQCSSKGIYERTADSDRLSWRAQSVFERIRIPDFDRAQVVNQVPTEQASAVSPK